MEEFSNNLEIFWMNLDDNRHNRQILWALFRSSCFPGAGRDRINSKTKFHIRWTETSVNADVQWRGASAIRGKGTIFHYGVKELE